MIDEDFISIILGQTFNYVHETNIPKSGANCCRLKIVSEINNIAIRTTFWCYKEKSTGDLGSDKLWWVGSKHSGGWNKEHMKDWQSEYSEHLPLVVT